jgi:UV DNA damage repair endonuclease
MNHYINTHHSDNIPIAIDTHHQTVVSGITDTSLVNDGLLRSTIATASRTESSSTMLTEPSQGTSKRGGRPKVTTRASKEALNGIYREALDEFAIEFATLKSFAITKSQKDVTGRRCRVPRGEFHRVVKIVCRKYNLEASEINVKAILSRTKL